MMPERVLPHEDQGETPPPPLSDGGREAAQARNRSGRRLIPALFGTLLLANLLAWLWAWAVFSDQPALLATALLAWIFGLRHAVDADHIAAIDNVVRKLMHEGRRPLLAGTYFSLGHSTVVALASALVATTAAGFQSRVAALHLLGGTLGTAVSAAFLLAIAVLNLAILPGVWRRFRAGGQGGATEPQVAAPGGLLARLFNPLFRAVSRSWHMLPLGFLFGLGFDTATEIGLLGLSATEAAHGISPWQTMVFPALFTAGMALVDSTDSVLMVGAYGWALHEPRRKLWYDLTLTGTSVIVAVVIGGMEVLGLLAQRLELHGRLWSALGAVEGNATRLGLAIVGFFLLVWATSAGMYCWRKRPAPALPVEGRR